MRFSTALFNAHLDDMGQNFLWRKASMCPCINPQSGAAKHNCPLCSGKGRSWSPPVQAKAGMASQRVLRAWAQFGQWESGDTVLSVPENSPLYDAGQFDRVTMLNATDRFNVVLTRGSNDKLHFPVRAIDRVYWIGASDTVVEGGIPLINSAGNFDWPDNAPPTGTQYSVSGERFAEYFMWDDMPGDRNHHYGERLPRKLVLRKFDLFGR